MTPSPPVGSAQAGSAISSLRHKFEAVAVPERAIAIMKMIRLAADAGQPCPSNRELSDAVGAASISTAAAVLSLLEGLNLIHVERFARSRIVTIIETGKKTAAPPSFVDDKPRYSAASIWTDDLDAALMDAVSEEMSFTDIGRAMGLTDSVVYRRFQKLRCDMGRQAW